MKLYFVKRSPPIIVAHINNIQAYTFIPYINQFIALMQANNSQGYSIPSSPLYYNFLQLSKYKNPHKSLHQYIKQSRQVTQRKQQLQNYSNYRQSGRLKHLFRSYDYAGQQITSNIKNRLRQKQIYIPQLYGGRQDQQYLLGESNFNRLQNPETRQLLKTRLNIFSQIQGQLKQLERLDYKTLHEIDEMNDRNYKMTLRKPTKRMFREDKFKNRINTQDHQSRIRQFNLQYEQMPRKNKFNNISRHKDFQKYIDYLQRSISPKINKSFIDQSRMITQPTRIKFRTPQHIKSASEVIEGDISKKTDQESRVIKVLRMVKNRGQSLLTKLTKYPSLKIVKKE